MDLDAVLAIKLYLAMLFFEWRMGRGGNKCALTMIFAIGFLYILSRPTIGNVLIYHRIVSLLVVLSFRNRES